MATAEDKIRLDEIRSRYDQASSNWRLTEGERRAEQLSANLLPNVPAVAIAVLTEDCGYQDRDFLLHAHADVHFLLSMLASAVRRIREMERQQEAPRADLAKECGKLCDDPVFRRFLSEKHGIKTSDRERIATSVRKMLQIESRSELNINPQAARRWKTLESRFVAWRDAP